MRLFKEVDREHMKFPDVQTELPERATSKSGGYDFRSKEDFILNPGCIHTFWTDVKILEWFDNVLYIHTRSGNGCKHGIIIRNGTGVIDADYADNLKNDGNIAICLENTGTEPFEVHIGDRIAQGVCHRYLIMDDDKYRFNGESVNDENQRNGGFGSTGVN